MYVHGGKSQPAKATFVATSHIQPTTAKKAELNLKIPAKIIGIGTTLITFSTIKLTAKLVRKSEKIFEIGGKIRKKTPSVFWAILSKNGDKKL